MLKEILMAVASMYICRCWLTARDRVGRLPGSSRAGPQGYLFYRSCTPTPTIHAVCCALFSKLLVLPARPRAMEHDVNGDEELWDFLISMMTSVGLVMVGMLCMRCEEKPDTQ